MQQLCLCHSCRRVNNSFVSSHTFDLAWVCFPRHPKACQNTIYRTLFRIVIYKHEVIFEAKPAETGLSKVKYRREYHFSANFLSSPFVIFVAECFKVFCFALLCYKFYAPGSIHIGFMWMHFWRFVIAAEAQATHYRQSVPLDLVLSWYFRSFLICSNRMTCALIPTIDLNPWV